MSVKNIHTQTNIIIRKCADGIIVQEKSVQTSLRVYQRRENTLTIFRTFYDNLKAKRRGVKQGIARNDDESLYEEKGCGNTKDDNA